MSNETHTLERLEDVATRVRAARTAVNDIVFGQEDVIDLTLVTLLAGGHGLLVGAPGVAKTLLVSTVAHAMSLDSRRVQFTPDLMPSDILGAEVLEEGADGKRAFRFVKGPIFTQLLMADEINRASPRTQSALLQAMQEKHVTVAGARHDLAAPFHVLATQNPLEQEGTYPLPEAQLDRFMTEIDVTYPAHEAEKRVIIETTGAPKPEPQAAVSVADLLEAQSLVRLMPMGEKVVEGILTIVRRGRPGPDAAEEANAHVSWGPGPRAGQALALTARAKAFLDGRPAPSLDDVLALAGPVLRHRMALTYGARAKGVRVDDVIEALCAPLA